MSYITTYTGKHFDPIQPEPGLFDLTDISHALSLLCRGNGHMKHFYSVAQHSIACAEEAKARGYAPGRFSFNVSGTHCIVATFGTSKVFHILSFQNQKTFLWSVVVCISSAILKSCSRFSPLITLLSSIPQA